MDRRSNAFVHSSLLFLAVLAIVLTTHLPSLIRKEKALHDRRTVALAINWGDLVLQQDPLASVEKFSSLGVRYIVIEIQEKPEVEKFLRSKGLKILWHADRIDPDLFMAFVGRLQEGDGVLPNEQGAFGYPGYLNRLGAELKNRNAFAGWVEFDSNKGIDLLSERGIPVEKAHLLHLEETLRPAPELWQARLIRAVRERAVRMLVVRLSPAWSPEEQQSFVNSVVTDLKSARYEIGPVSTNLPPWGKGHGRWGTLFSWLSAALGPLAGLVIALHFFPRKPWRAYAVVMASSVLAGLTAHVLAFSPLALSGLVEFHGVKMALVTPLFLSIPLLIPFSSIRLLGDQPVRYKHVLIVGGIGILFIGGILVRSGNFPWLAVSGPERRMRDLLESIFFARPRFKEFLIGTPLLLHGLHQRAKDYWNLSAVTTDRVLIILGMVGPASVVNTFCHLHIPLTLDLLRTIHGIWLGIVIYEITLLIPFFRGKTW